MASHTTNRKEPFMAPGWLADAAKKRSGPAPQAFLDRLQYSYEHPAEFKEELREKQIQAGQDPNAFVKLMAEENKATRPVSLDLQPQDASAMTSKETRAGHLQSKESAATIERDNSIKSSLPRWTWTRPQLSVRLTGRITKPTQNRANKAPTQAKSASNRRSRSKSGTASPMDVDPPQTIAESSAAGASRMPESAGSGSTTQSTSQPYPFPARPQLPNWHTSITPRSLELYEKRHRHRPQEIAAIDALKACIERCEKNRLAKDFKDLRDHVHKAEIMLKMDKFKVRKTRILTEDGLPRIFAEAAGFPWDLKADAWHLYQRWVSEDFDNNILRGIVTVKEKDRNGDRLDPTYRNQHPQDPKVFGDNGAVLGQWWPTQLCVVRDGIHGAPQAGKLYFTLF
jgi:uncharacterized protein (UPF0335 family)